MGWQCQWVGRWSWQWVDNGLGGDPGLCPWDWSTRYCTYRRERPSLLDLLSEFGLISDGWLGSISPVGDWANALECWRSPSLRLVIPGIAVPPGVTHSDSHHLWYEHCRKTPTTTLTLVPVMLIDGAIPVPSARVGQRPPDGSFEEALAPFARELSVMLARTLVTAHNAFQPGASAAVRSTEREIVRRSWGRDAVVVAVAARTSQRGFHPGFDRPVEGTPFLYNVQVCPRTDRGRPTTDRFGHRNLHLRGSLEFDERDWWVVI